MKTAQQIIEEQKAIAKERDLNNDGVISEQENKEYLLRLASQLLTFLRNETLKVEETSPKDYDKALTAIEKAVVAIPRTKDVSVNNLKDYNAKLDALLLAIKQIKIPEVVIPKTIIPDNKKELKSIETAVKMITIPEVVIPEQKPVDFSVLIKEIKTLGKALDSQESTGDVKTQNILSAVLNKLESGLSSIESSINKLDKEPEVQIDRTDEIIKGLKAVSQTINDIKFPVPQISTTGIIDAINNMSVSIGDIHVNTEGIATEATLAKVEAEVREYGINYIENASATLTYIGKEDKDGNWLIVKIDTTTGYAISYATYLNNGTLAPNTYTHAWTDRATLTYGTFSAAI